MPAGTSVRIYANPVKVLLLLVVALLFVAAGDFMLQDPKLRADGVAAASAYVTIGIFGFGALAFLAMTVRFVVLRRPLLEIDARGWHYSRRWFWGTKFVSWPDIAAVGAFRQRLPRGSSTYYLFLVARDPETIPHRRLKLAAGGAYAYAVAVGAALLAQLNPVFLRTTPQKCTTLLKRIRAQCADELRFYGIKMEGTVRE